MHQAGIQKMAKCWRTLCMLPELCFLFLLKWFQLLKRHISSKIGARFATLAFCWEAVGCLEYNISFCFLFGSRISSSLFSIFNTSCFGTRFWIATWSTGYPLLPIYWNSLTKAYNMWNQCVPSDVFIQFLAVSLHDANGISPQLGLYLKNQNTNGECLWVCEGR